MKKIPALLIIMAAIALCGCSTVGNATTKVFDQIALVRDEFNALLPSDFKGPIDLSRSDSYFTITLKAGNVHRLDTGEWSWDWVEYQRLTHIPGWSSNVHFKIGSPRS